MAKLKITNRVMYRGLPKRSHDSIDTKAAIRPRGPRSELASEPSVTVYSTDSISEDEDDVNSEPIVGRPTKDEERKWKDDDNNHPYARFISSQSGFGDDSWVGRQPLGAGSFGIAGLWERVTVSGRVIDQMVVKQIGSRKWKKEMPREATIMRKLNEADCNSLVRYRGHRRYPKYRVHRIYMEYCPYGDLKKLVNRYRRFGHYFPEPFLWETFHYLVEAAAAMRDGPQNCKVEEQWDKEIVHCDLKPANVFLGYEDTASGVPFYPTAKFGDFGLSFETDEDDILNPWKYRGQGTLDYQAPEQLSIKTHTLAREHVHDLSKRRIPKKILAHTNVWAIGATMFNLLTLERITHCLNKGHKGVKDDVYERMMKKPKNGRLVKYSKELRDLIRDCLHAMPEERVTIDLLQENIKRYRDVVSKKYSFQGKSRPTPNQQDRVYYNGDEINELGAGTFKPLRRLEPPEEEESGPQNDSVRIKFPPRPDVDRNIPRDSFQKDNFGVDTKDELDGPEGVNNDKDDDDDAGLLPAANLNGQQLFEGVAPRSSVRKGFIPPGGRAPRGTPTSIGRKPDHPIVLSDESGVKNGPKGEDNDEEQNDSDEGHGRQHSKGWKGPRISAPLASNSGADDNPEQEDKDEDDEDEDDEEEDEEESKSDSFNKTDSEHDTTSDEEDSEKSNEDDQDENDSDSDDSSAGNPDTRRFTEADSNDKSNDSEEPHNNPTPGQPSTQSRPNGSASEPPKDTIQPPQEANLMYLARATGSAMKRLFSTSASKSTSQNPNKTTSNQQNKDTTHSNLDNNKKGPETPTSTSSSNKRKRTLEPNLPPPPPPNTNTHSHSHPPTTKPPTTTPHNSTSISKRQKPKPTTRPQDSPSNSPSSSSENIIHTGNYRHKRRRG